MCKRAKWVAICICTTSNAFSVDLKRAVVVSPANFSPQEKNAVRMLIEEVEKRSRIRWAAGPSAASNADAIVSVTRRDGSPEGYAIRIDTTGAKVRVEISGNDARGVLFGIGRLLRELEFAPGAVALPDGFHVATAPKYPLRGHQLGYRPKTNSYDAWSVPIWEQYIRDLAVFGTNAVELIPPRSDDAVDSPHFPLPPLQMMIEMSRLLDEYGLDVWIWYPAMDKDYSDPKTVDFAVREWSEVFRQLPRIDAVFVPGGDPGHTQPKYLMALLEKETQALHRYHPKAQMWVSPQSFSQPWLDEFYSILKTEPPWLSGVVFGPQVRVSLPQLRASIPKKYPIRHYPDITHSRQCQFPVPDWDTAYAVTEAREVINPRPTGEAQIFRLLQPYTIGFLTYSEGCNDDVNKIIWSALGWDPEASVIDILRQFSRYFIGGKFSDSFAQGLLALERNWQDPLLTNGSVYSTLQQFQSMERAATPETMQNWRFQQALYRAYYDAYTRSRLLYETGLEEQAMDRLRASGALGGARAMSDAEDILDRAITHRVSEDWRARVFELAEALFQSIRMQLSVPRYKAISVDRGASLDTIDVPLNSRLWLKQRFAEIRKRPDESERIKEIEEIVNWTNAGPGGFYDNPGSVTEQPHLIKGPGFIKDPAFLESALIGFGLRGANRMSWWNHAESLNDAPLKMHYGDLDRAAQYKIRIVYAGDSPRQKIRLMAADGIEIHPFIEKAFPIRPQEFDIPRNATQRGELDLSWFREPKQGGNGRGCQVAEVWLIKK